ncbi:endosome-associated-trafficking regulator 1 [Ischnura elegans]|uniref:endosome-associated-trafficking regulator 1 n=1 Tax=Ischnura elegans TaxID=197161 RepID=UPI001ED876CC|nr:endosome-associated-trafficking regulator 1 [Ischnura elegans]
MIMAEGGSGGEEKPFPNYKLAKGRSRHSDEDEENDSDAEDVPVQPDIGLGSEPSYDKKSNVDIQGQENNPSRSENPFSFKVFLKRDVSRNTYSSTGARPKVYSHPVSDSKCRTENGGSCDDHSGTPRPSSSRMVGTPELTSALPDFVQDHLVMEQCYLAEPPTQGLPDLDNLPDFALGGSDAISIGSGQSPNRQRLNNSSGGIHHGVANRSLDLRPGAVSPPGVIPQGPSEVATSKSLPDFLSDGPILGGRLSNPPDVEVPSGSPHTPPDSDPLRLAQENERLRWELDICRRQLSDESVRVQSLEHELYNMRRRESEETATLAKSIEQVEDNLKRTTRRAVSAETTVSKLKQEIKAIMVEMSELRRENDRLQGCFRGGGASAPEDTSASASAPLQPQTRVPQQVATEILAAANSAEHSLRQLLGGVDNLRVLAATLESMYRIQESPSDGGGKEEEEGGGEP